MTAQKRRLTERFRTLFGGSLFALLFSIFLLLFARVRIDVYDRWLAGIVIAAVAVAMLIRLTIVGVEVGTERLVIRSLWRTRTVSLTNVTGVEVRQLFPLSRNRCVWVQLEGGESLRVAAVSGGEFSRDASSRRPGVFRFSATARALAECLDVDLSTP